MTFPEKIVHLQGMLYWAGVKHFNADEFMQERRGEPDESILWRIVPTALVLQDAREAFGPIHITNGYRSKDYNASIGGAPDSMHMQMCAADASPVHATARDLWRFFEEHPMAPLMGIGRYATFVHVDTRGILGRSAPARWDNTGS